MLSNRFLAASRTTPPDTDNKTNRLARRFAVFSILPNCCLRTQFPAFSHIQQFIMIGAPDFVKQFPPA